MQSSPSLVLSCDFNDSKPWEGDKIGIIITKDGYYKCLSCTGPFSYNCSKHILPLVKWVEEHADDGYCDLFDGYCLKSKRLQEAPSISKDGTGSDAHHSVSRKLITLNFWNSASVWGGD